MAASGRSTVRGPRAKSEALREFPMRKERVARRFPRLGDLELRVLKHLWSHGPADAKTIHRAVGKAHGISVNTVLSALKRLYDKDLLTREKVSHAHVYATRISREEFGWWLLEDALIRALDVGATELVQTVRARLLTSEATAKASSRDAASGA